MKKNKIDASQLEWTVDRGTDEKYMDTQLLLHKKVTWSFSPFPSLVSSFFGRDATASACDT